ncbi:hypothetical protein BB559_005245 [Furculomyces boomerangus]|uniref:CBM-cenC domain-containing protein n=1 Tax=Furculomyces boomerangus TaxID=61424 RepID=A0A2T9Y9S0_9FUNG|nr:hypothetical protein BB559_005245 [Furculomyces boomerangus]
MLTKFFIIIYFHSFLKLIIAGCTVSESYDLHSWAERYNWSDNYCCDSSNYNNCKYGIVSTKTHTSKVAVMANAGFFDSVKVSLNSEYTYTKQWQMKIDMDIRPGTCKYVDISTTRVERFAKGECCYWVIFWTCSKQETRWHYTRDRASYVMMEVQYRNGRIGRGAPVEIERGEVLPNLVEEEITVENLGNETTIN